MHALDVRFQPVFLFAKHCVKETFPLPRGSLGLSWTIILSNNIVTPAPICPPMWPRSCLELYWSDILLSCYSFFLHLRLCGHTGISTNVYIYIYIFGEGWISWDTVLFVHISLSPSVFLFLSFVFHCFSISPSLSLSLSLYLSLSLSLYLSLSLPVSSSLFLLPSFSGSLFSLSL